jgi:hypothetical protein
MRAVTIVIRNTRSDNSVTRAVRS